jgi:O-antigen/teichoic acid export membrane protein
MLAYQLAFAVSRTLFIPAFVAGRVALQVLAEIATRAAVLALAILVIAIRPSGVSLIESLLGLPVFGAALLIAALVCARRFAGPLRLVLRAGALRPALASIWPFAAANVLSGIYTRTAILVLFFAAGSIEAGLFASAWKFTELSWALLILVPWAGYPALARLFQRNDAHFRALADRVFAVTVLCGGAFAWGTYWVVPALAERTLGAEFAGSGLILQVMAGFVALAAVNEFLERIALVAGLQMMRLKILTGQTVLNVILTFVLVPRYGMLGAAVALVASQAVTIPALLAAVQPCMQARAAARTLGIYALALGGAASLTALPAQAISTWAAAALSLLTFASIMHAGGALRLARAGAAWRSAEAWGR